MVNRMVGKEHGYTNMKQWQVIARMMLYIKGTAASKAHRIKTENTLYDGLYRKNMISVTLWSRYEYRKGIRSPHIRRA